jgi:hypothetical protein
VPRKPPARPATAIIPFPKRKRSPGKKPRRRSLGAPTKKRVPVPKPEDTFDFVLGATLGQLELLEARRCLFGAYIIATGGRRPSELQKQLEEEQDRARAAESSGGVQSDELGGSEPGPTAAQQPAPARPVSEPSSQEQPLASFALAAFNGQVPDSQAVAERLPAEDIRLLLEAADDEIQEWSRVLFGGMAKPLAMQRDRRTATSIYREIANNTVAESTIDGKLVRWLTRDQTKKARASIAQHLGLAGESSVRFLLNNRKLDAVERFLDALRAGGAKKT